MENSPKYVLIYEPNPHATDYVYRIYEQAIVDGKIMSKIITSDTSFEGALALLTGLNDGKPVVLAQSTKMMDNTFEI